MTQETKPIGKDNNLSLIFGENARTKVIYVLIFMYNKKLTK